MMRRIVCAAALAAAIAGFASSPTSAGKPAYGCPNASSGYVRVDKDGWMERTLAGFAEEGIDTIDELNVFAVQFGFDDWAALADWIIGDQWDKFNHNETEEVCIKDLPNTRGLPGYIFGGIDDQSSSKG